MWDGTHQSLSCWSNNPQNIITNENIHPKVKDREVVVTMAAEDRKPHGCLHWEVWCDVTSINWEVPNAVTALKGGCGAPVRVRVSSSDCLLHV
jgi:hypothetical protein